MRVNMRADKKKKNTDRVTGNTSSKTTAEDKDSVSSSPLISLQQFRASGPKFYTLYTHVHYVWSFVRLPQPGAAKAQTAKLSGLHLKSSQVLCLYLPLSYDVLPPCHSVSLSLLSKPLQEPDKLHCYLTLTFQLEWHTYYNLTILTLQHYNDSFIYSSSSSSPIP